MITQENIKNLFKNLEDGNAEQFFAQVEDDVNWQVMGTHPLAGVYQSKQAFFDATFARLNNALKDGVILKVLHVYVDGLTAIVEMKSLSTGLNGKPFDNTYCWIVKFNASGKISQVRAYVDSALVKEAIEENEAL